MGKYNEFNEPLIRKAPILDMTDLYTVPGSVQEVIASLSIYPEAQRLFTMLRIKQVSTKEKNREPLFKT